jgi:hypothetical protein
MGASITLTASCAENARAASVITSSFVVSCFESVQGSHDRVERELARERAAALRRIGERLAELLEDLDRRQAGARERAGGAGDGERKAYEAVRAEARRYRWFLEVQRESVGLRSHASLDEFYPIPGALDG